MARSQVALWALLFGLYAATLAVDAAPGEPRWPEEVRMLAAAEQLADGGGLDRGPQGIGLPLLLAPFAALGGATLCALAIAASGALAFVLAAALARRVVPDPWATWAALAVGVSAPVLADATALVPALPAGALLAGAMLCALRVRERPSVVSAFTGAVLLAVLPWLDPWLLVPAAPVAVLLARWTARRGRGLVALGTAEVQLASLVFYVSLNERLYGRFTPLDPPELGTASLGERVARVPELLWDLRWAPVVALAGVGAWLLWRSRRERLSRLVADQRDAEHAAFLALAVCGAQLLVAAFATPAVDGASFPGRLLVPALPAAVPLVAWGFRRAPRVGAALAAATAAVSAWVVASGSWTPPGS